MNMEEFKSRKRRRAASDPNRHTCQRFAWPEPALPSNLVHDPEFWFEDGSVVLVALNVGFRVYRRILQEHSPFFKDMFRMPQPANALKVEGCPVVVLADTPHQLRHMLRVLFPTGGNLRFGKQEATLTMDAVAAVIRLAHKYQMDQLLAQALSALMEFYTDDFYEFVKQDRKVTMTAMPIDAITAISLARLTSTPSILPLAYLHASCAGSQVLHGCVRDGAWAEPLAYADLVRIIDGRPALTHAMDKMVCRIFKPETSDACSDSRRCLRIMTARTADLPEYLDMAYGTMFAPGVTLGSFTHVHGGIELTTGMRLCERCRAMLKERELEEKKELWNDIPNIFNLEEPEGWQVE